MLSLASAFQTVGGAAGKAETAAEVRHVMTRFVGPAIKRLVAKHRAAFDDGDMGTVLLACDNSKPHSSAMNSALIRRMGLPHGTDQLLQHPPSSPDFQAPVEWSHSWVKSEVFRRIREDPRVRSPEEYKKLIHDTFYGLGPGGEVVGPGRVSRAISAWRDNLRVILQQQGGYGNARAS